MANDEHKSGTLKNGASGGQLEIIVLREQIDRWEKLYGKVFPTAHSLMDEDAYGMFVDEMLAHRLDILGIEPIRL